MKRAERYRAGRVPTFAKEDESSTVIVSTPETKQEIKIKAPTNREQNHKVVAEIIEVVKKTRPPSPSVVAEIGNSELFFS